MDGLGAALLAAAESSAAQEKPHEDGAEADPSTSSPEEARIRLQFTSPTKPALITGSARIDDDSDPDYRYLVVPLRALVG